MIFHRIPVAAVTDDIDPRTTPPATTRIFTLPLFCDERGSVPTASVALAVRVLTAGATVTTNGIATLTLYLRGTDLVWRYVGVAAALVNDQIASIAIPATRGTTDVFVAATSISGASGTNIEIDIAAAGPVASSGGTAGGALETGGHLATIDTSTAKIPAKGTATMTGSMPVTIATDDTQVTAIKNSVAAIPAKGTAAMAASTPVTIASDDVIGLAIKANTGPVAPQAGAQKTTITTTVQIQSASAVCVLGVYLSNPTANGTSVFVGTSNLGAAGANGVEIPAGQSLFWPCTNVNQIYAFAASSATLNWVPF